MQWPETASHRPLRNAAPGAQPGLLFSTGVCFPECHSLRMGSVLPSQVRFSCWLAVGVCVRLGVGAQRQCRCTLCPLGLSSSTCLSPSWAPRPAAMFWGGIGVTVRVLCAGPHVAKLCCFWSWGSAWGDGLCSQPPCQGLLRSLSAYWSSIQPGVDGARVSAEPPPGSPLRRSYRIPPHLAG